MGIYEKEWKDKQKPIKTIEDAVLVLAAKGACWEVHGCENCPIYCYSRVGYKTADCYETTDYATKLLKEEDVIFETGDGMNAFALETPAPKDKKPDQSPIPFQISFSYTKDGKCTNCQHKKLLEGGYLFCTKFHNTTIPEGYCHNFEEVSDLE